MADLGAVGVYLRLAEPVAVRIPDGKYLRLAEPIFSFAPIGRYFRLAERINAGELGRYLRLAELITVYISDDEGGISLVQTWVVVVP